MRYTAIMSDPAWPYRSQDLKAAPLHRPNTWDDPTGGVAAAERYNLLSVDGIKALPVGQIATADAHLYLWTTNSFMVEAHEVAAAWGFERASPGPYLEMFARSARTGWDVWGDQAPDSIALPEGA